MAIETISRSPLSPSGEKLKYHPFWGSPLLYKAPPRQFQPPKCKLTPSKIQIWRGEISGYSKYKFGEGRFLVISKQKPSRLEGVNLHFANCILEAEIVLGVLHTKGKRTLPSKIANNQVWLVPTRFGNSQGLHELPSAPLHARIKGQKKTHKAKKSHEQHQRIL